MKKLYITIIFMSLLYATNTIASDEYTKCLDENYTTKDGIVKCANEETDRIMEQLNKRYGIVANHKYFRPWNNQINNFTSLKSTWLKYRDSYCNLLGFSILNPDNSRGEIEEARCKLSETVRFQQQIEALVKNYQKTLKPKL